MVPARSLSLARVVLREAPDLADIVIADQVGAPAA
jgi:hypothetical protein